MNRRLVKVGEGYYPFDEETRIAMQRIPIGSFLYSNITMPRNNAFHNKYFALLAVVVPHLDIEGMTVDRLHIHIKANLGMVSYYAIGEKVYPEYESISFSSMDELTFHRFFDQAMDVLLRQIPIDKKKLMDEVNDFIEGKRRVSSQVRKKAKRRRYAVHH